MPTTRTLKKPCKATTAKGTPCHAAPGPDGYCFQHSPGVATERDAARSRGGTKRMLLLTVNNALRVDPDTEIKDLADAQKLLSRVIIEVANTPTLARYTVGEKGRTIATLTSVLMRSFDISENEQRFAEGLKRLAQVEKQLKIKLN